MKKAFFITLFVLNVCFSFAQKANNELLTQFDVLNNKPFPAFDLENEKGDTFNTASLKGKTLYIDFWFTQCPPCLKEIPYAKALRSFFAADTNIVFVNICIEPVERKQAWKDMIKEKEIGGINLFYAKNRPQKVNLLREYKVLDYPTYMLVNSEMVIIGHNAPRPSDKGLAQWAIYQGTKNMKVSDAYKQFIKNSEEVKEYISRNSTLTDSLYPKPLPPTFSP